MSPQNIRYEGIKSKFTETPGRRHLDEVIQVNDDISNKTNQNHVPPGMNAMMRRSRIPSVIVLREIQNPDLLAGGHQMHPRL